MPADMYTKLSGLTNYALPVAKSNTLGGIKTGYTTSTSDKNYKV
jgi:hypothetical protein